MKAVYRTPKGRADRRGATRVQGTSSIQALLLVSAQPSRVWKRTTNSRDSLSFPTDLPANLLHRLMVWRNTTFPSLGTMLEAGKAVLPRDPDGVRANHPSFHSFCLCGFRWGVIHEIRQVLAQITRRCRSGTSFPDETHRRAIKANLPKTRMNTEKRAITYALNYGLTFMYSCTLEFLIQHVHVGGRVSF